jgi:hypothetical protein
MDRPKPGDVKHGVFLIQNMPFVRFCWEERASHSALEASLGASLLVHDAAALTAFP